MFVSVNFFSLPVSVDVRLHTAFKKPPAAAAAAVADTIALVWRSFHLWSVASRDAHNSNAFDSNLARRAGRRRAERSNELRNSDRGHVGRLQDPATGVNCTRCPIKTGPPTNGVIFSKS